jgi:hypothetical protein
MQVAAEPTRRTFIALPLGAVLASGASRRAASQTAAGTVALPRLAVRGVELAPVAVDSAHVDISIAIDLGGDVPLASYMTARPRGLRALQRNAAGAWVVWDERPESLIDNRFGSSGGKLVFAVTGADFSKQSFPVAVSVAYRTSAGVKFGVFTMTPKP